MSLPGKINRAFIAILPLHSDNNRPTGPVKQNQTGAGINRKDQPEATWRLTVRFLIWLDFYG